MDTTTIPASKYYIVASLPSGEEELAKVLFNHLNCIPVFSDHSPQITTFGAVRDGLAYVSSITKDDEIALVIDSYASHYSNSLQDVDRAMQDFLAGWNAFKAMADRKEEAAANLAAEKAIKVGDHVQFKYGTGTTYAVTNVGSNEVRMIRLGEVGLGGWYLTSDLKKVKAPK